MTPYMETDHKVVVQQRTRVADGIVEFVLGAPDDSELPKWEPGAHIDLVLDSTAVRQYSLCGDPSDRFSYRIAVLREREGRGVSRRIHDELQAGDPVIIRGPRNHFRLESSPSYVFIAGGIGITPLLPMIRQADAAGRPWQLHYAGRQRTTMAYATELEVLGKHVAISPSSELGRIDVTALLGDVPTSSMIYCCGPQPLLAATEAAAERFGLSCRTERFVPRQITDAVDAAFTVRLEATGIELRVPPDRSLLDILIDADIDVLSSCEEGTCGTCEVAVLDGVPDHRDSVLTRDEQAAYDRMMVCVSRARSQTIVLDL